MVFKIYFEKDERERIEIQEFLDQVEKNNSDLHVQILAKIELVKNSDNHGKALTEHIEKDLYALRSEKTPCGLAAELPNV